MNNKLVIGIIVLAIAGVAGFMLVGNRATANKTSDSQTGTAAVQTGQNTVQATADGFVPQTLTIKAGTKITWVNQSGTDISVNSNNHPTHLLYPPLNLGRVPDGGSASLTFDTPGSYGYHNHLTPSQTGTIVVE